MVTFRYNELHESLYSADKENWMLIPSAIIAFHKNVLKHKKEDKRALEQLLSVRRLEKPDKALYARVGK